jgi:hypothetical protein
MPIQHQREAKLLLDMLATPLSITVLFAVCRTNEGGADTATLLVYEQTFIDAVRYSGGNI